MLSVVKKQLRVGGGGEGGEGSRAVKAYGGVAGVGGFLDSPRRRGDAQGTGHGAISGYLIHVFHDARLPPGSATRHPDSYPRLPDLAEGTALVRCSVKTHVKDLCSA